MDLENLRFPIGRASIPKEIEQKDLAHWISTIEKFPQKLDALTVNLNPQQLDTPYRENGWTVRQVVHHCYDSHHNSYTRFKWGLTEDSPIIKLILKCIGQHYLIQNQRLFHFLSMD